MTAEIAVLNQEAVALAADSAVSGPKIFTSANKIFALSKYQPVAVMVYDSAQFLDVPWETIIKTYRAELGERSFRTLEEQAKHFIDFFDRENPLFSEDSQRRAAELVYWYYFRQLLRRIDSQLESLTADGTELTKDEISEVVEGVIAAAHSAWVGADDIPTLPPEHAAEVIAAYSGEIREAESAFQNLPLSDEARGHLRDLAGALLSKDRANRSSPYHSGVVIAGFGNDEFFPCLYEFELETVALNRLKLVRRDTTEIGHDNPAVVRAFAQMEQVATFMEGIDAAVTEVTLNYWGDRLRDLVGDVADELEIKGNDKRKLRQDMDDRCNEIVERFANELTDFQWEMYIEPIIRIVTMMPKDELAAMAESLVNLTSFKRKVTAEAETVGGPIDVAVISKGDGLVWIKRKHYFKPELNQQFFANYYREGG